MADQHLQTIVDEHPVMHWGAVFSGWLVATGMALVLYAFGFALGLSAFDPRNAAAVTHGVSVAVSAWTILTWGASLWIGGMVASWFDGRDDAEMGVVRGLTVWGLSMVSTALLAASGLMHALVSIVPQVNGPTVSQPQAAHYVATLMWVAFASALVSLITSVVGGWLGAHHVHHVYHLRKYTRQRVPALGR